MKRIGLYAAVVILSGPVFSSRAAILEFEDFSASAAGWGDRDVDEMDVSWTGSSMLGEFLAQDVAIPETDAFRLTSGSFVGDLWSAHSGYYLTFLTFDFTALAVAASDLIIRISDGISTFSRGLTPTTGFKSVSLASSSGWFGGGDAAFSNALSNVQYIDIQITRSGIGAQSFSFDNLTLNGEQDFGGGEGPSAVPEPNTLSLLMFLCIIGFGLRRSLRDSYNRKMAAMRLGVG